jgi:toluene monooxygenase system ferredoxin subunit
MALRKVTTLDELWSGELVGHVVDGRKILLARLGDDVYAYEDRCAHLGLPLSDGSLDGPVLTCSAHHYQYDVRTGAGVNPLSVCLHRYTVRIEGRDVLVDTGQPATQEGQ